jgi:peptide/nickel transport system permease protein
MIRGGAAIVLPLIVPAAISAVLWALPGDPASILCPPGVCPDLARTELAVRWHLDAGPVEFYAAWVQSALEGDFGRSWRVAQGVPVRELLVESLPQTAALLGLAAVPLALGGVLAALGKIPKRLDGLWQAFGLVPAVILALLGAAYVQITWGALSYEGTPALVRLGFAALTLGLTDGALAGAVLGTRSVFEEENKRRYVQIAVMRGESQLANALPNVLPALLGQTRSRLLHLLSGAVVVEVVLQVPGIGELLWQGTLLQDFGVVLAAATGFALLSAALLLAQAVGEVAVALWVRGGPAVPR